MDYAEESCEVDYCSLLHLGKLEEVTLNCLLRTKEICGKTMIWSLETPAYPSFKKYLLVDLLFITLSIDAFRHISLCVYIYVNNMKK